MRRGRTPFGRPEAIAWCEVVGCQGMLPPRQGAGMRKRPRCLIHLSQESGLLLPPAPQIQAKRLTNHHSVALSAALVGPPRLTQDSVERMVVWKVNYPESVQRKAGAIHGLVAMARSRRW